MTGFGCAIVVTYILYLIQLVIVTRILFGTRVSKSEWTTCIITCSLIILSLITKSFCPEIPGYIVGTIILIITGIFSFYELNKRMDLISTFKKKLFAKKLES